jgi:perosamine synthetase
MGLPKHVLPRIERALYSGFLAEGDEVYAFEREFAEVIQNPHLIAVSSGSAALHLALLASGVGPGDEVVSTPVTAEPTNVVIKQTGAKIVWADSDPYSGLMDPESVVRCIGPATKAIVAVDYAGTPAPLATLQKIANGKGITLIEDAAQAFGAEYQGKPVGSHADFVIFSFQAIKSLTSGDGGVLAFTDSRHLERLRRLRWFGMDRTLPRATQKIDEVGYKYTMNNITAALARAQLEHVEEPLRRHMENAQIFDEALVAVDAISPIKLPVDSRSSYWLYTLFLNGAKERDVLSKALTSANIASGQVHRRNDLHPIFAESRTILPGVDAFYERMLHIPCGWWVGPEERERILTVIARENRL